MSTKTQRKSGNWEYGFRHRLLPARVSVTFDTEAEGDAFSEVMEALLGRGVVPVELSGGAVKTFRGLLERFEKTPLSQSDKELLPALGKRVGDVRIERLTYAWVEEWVKGMEREGLAPSTVIKRVGLLARCVDWAMRRELVSCVKNPLRLLPRGYATKGRVSKERAWAGERDRRLSQTEEGALRSVLTEKKGREEELMLFEMALESAMRLREMYTLSREQIDFAQRTIFLDKTKNGSKRQVPMSSVLVRALQEYLPRVQDRVFPVLWDGRTDAKALRDTTTRLSQRFARRCAEAGCPDFRLHDLRHTAVCRFYERTSLSDVEISKITGHSDLRMLRRYANLRGSDLSRKLW